MEVCDTKHYTNIYSHAYQAADPASQNKPPSEKDSQEETRPYMPSTANYTN